MTSTRATSTPEAPRLVTLLMRLVVGGVFIFSGFVKAVDPWGGFYKITDYLQALGWEGMMPLALFGAFALAAVEFVLGVLLVTGSLRHLAPALLLLLMIPMLPLTLWLAVTDAVRDCGCFGDAWHLSNWATFAKNIFITLGLVYLLRFNTQWPGIYGPAVQWLVGTLSFAFVMAVATAGYMVQPLIDYRPYGIGTRLVAAGADSNNDEDYIFVYERDGVQQDFSIDSVPDEDDTSWTFVQRYRRTRDKVEAPVDSLPTAGVAIFDGTFDVGDDLLADNHAKLILLMPDLEKVGIAYTFVINDLQDFAVNHGATVWALTAGSEAQIEHWREIAMADYPIYVADDSEIKMMARGNPAVLYVDENNVVMWKRTLNSINPSRLKTALDIDDINGNFDPDAIMIRMFIAFMTAMGALLLVNRSHLVVLAFMRRLQRKKTTTVDMDND